MMLHKWIMLTAAVFSTSAFAATNFNPKFDPSHLKGPEAGRFNEVLVLGTPHLRGLPASFEPSSLAPLIARLEAWKPQIITIEALSGAQCDYMRRYSVRYADSVKSYCWDTTPARTATGLDVPAAVAEVERLLAAWPAAPTAAERRHLAAIFLAAGERASALVQWLRLPPAEQKEGDGLDKTLVSILQERATRRDESYLIAAPLAARLGLERVYATDDHTADSSSTDEADDKAAGEIIQGLWNNPATAKRTVESKALEANLGSAEGLLAMYRAYNKSEQALLVYQSDFGAAMKDRSAKQYGRNYVGYWETRNLRMVSNIRDILGATPGKRTLTIVGASHKGYFEAYLNMMHDVRLVDAEVILR
ncbi:MAG: DUF5694 domain-containing protein [Pseudomonadota bacterium]